MAASEIMLERKTVPFYLLGDVELELQAYLWLFLIPLQNHFVILSMPPILQPGKDCSFSAYDTQLRIHASNLYLLSEIQTTYKNVIPFWAKVQVVTGIYMTYAKVSWSYSLSKVIHFQNYMF